MLVGLGVAAGVSGGAAAQDATRLSALSTGDDSRGWEAVGRLDLANRGFCTATLIAHDLVLTAAHCLFDKATGRRVNPEDITFLAGWRNGRAVAYRGVRRDVVHPDYVFSGTGQVDRVEYDLALLQLDHPIRLPSITPFLTHGRDNGFTQVGVVSYAKDRANVPSLQEVCPVLARQPGMLVMGCSVDFGSSGAPVFVMDGATPRIVSVVSAKAEMQGRNVALGVSLTSRLAVLERLLEQGDGVFYRPARGVRNLSSSEDRKDLGAKFVRP
jgi:V8-like Glu-specific endopeptidase